MRIPLYVMITLTAGCGLLFGGEVRVLGTVHIEFIHRTDPSQPDVYRPAIEVPETVSVAVPFSVSVLTEGDGCYRGGDTDVDVTGSTAIITPYDYSTAEVDGGSDDLCEANLTLFEHGVQVTFDARGASTVVVRSRTSSSDTEPIEYEYAVWVE